MLTGVALSQNREPLSMERLLKVGLPVISRTPYVQAPIHRAMTSPNPTCDSRGLLESGIGISRLREERDAFAEAVLVQRKLA